MAFVYPQIEIGGTSYPAYVDLNAANAYMNASVNALTWAALSDDEKGRAIVSAVRVIDAQNWKGEKLEADNTLEWPRTCLEGSAGTLPAPLVTANIQLAYYISQNPEIASAASGSTSGDAQTKRLKAGSVEIEYFFNQLTSSQTIGSTIAGVLSPLADCLEGSGDISSVYGGAFASGTDRASPFEHGYPFTRGI